jgi:activator of HSP90 ATPase
MTTKTIRQRVSLPAEPQVVYRALMDSKQHAAFTGDTARISPNEGGAFTAGSGYISGKNLKLVPGKTIVQTWHASDWPPGHWSQVTFRLAKKGRGTVLSFVHAGVPSEFYADIRQGWIDFYWEPLKQYLAR